MNPLLLTDGYKLGHRVQYPDGTQFVYSNWTPRKSRIPGVNKVMCFGVQMVVQMIHEMFEESFFARDVDEVCFEYQEVVEGYLGTPYDVTHIRELHKVGYLPLHIKCLSEGSRVPIGVPMLTVTNTLSKFFWLTNYLETLLSSLLWGVMTSATLAFRYREILDRAAQETSSVPEFVDWQGHDFSFRGMYGDQAAVLSGCGHALMFTGSDTIPVIPALRKYYDAEGLIVASVNATEHSVMSAGGKEDELETFRRLLRVYPTGVLSVVSDTWNLWDVCTKYLPALKSEILNRDGKLVIRPDSGDPVDIICGEGLPMQPSKGSRLPKKEIYPEHKGVIELLWDVFGGTVNDKGFKELDPHIGAIYGDSITLDRAQDICDRLKAKGFASTNIVLGIGSFTYQHNTRDTLGFAMKATHVVINGESKDIFKNPVTDTGEKKSAKGLLKVSLVGGEYQLTDQVNVVDEITGCLKLIYDSGHFFNRVDLKTVRENAKSELR